MRKGRLVSIASMSILLLAGVPTVSAGDGLTCLGEPVTMVGTPGHDDLHGTPGPDVIYGGRGGDIIRGGGGRDRLCGGRGGDALIGGPGFDRFDGGPWHDLCLYRDHEPFRRCEQLDLD